MWLSALVAAAALLEAKIDVEQIVDNIDKMAAVLRAKVVKYFEREEQWKESWVCDEEATQVTEAGPVPSSPAAFVEAMRRPKRWMCHRAAAAAAQVLYT